MVRIVVIGCGAVLLHAPGVLGQVAAPSGRFQHERHASYECSTCHTTGSATTESNRKWCADCHHVNVGYGQCRQCHTVQEIAPEPVRALVRFKLPGEQTRTRSLQFDHNIHGQVGCGSCHTGGAQLLAQAECASCHTDHHRAEADCLACHSEPLVTAHTDSVHLDLAGCGSAGCHVGEGIDFAALRGGRNLCLSCHVAQREHEKPDACEDCHILSESGVSPGESP